MIEAGQVEQRARHAPSPPSSVQADPQDASTNAPAQDPPVEKSESVSIHSSDSRNWPSL